MAESNRQDRVIKNAASQVFASLAQSVIGIVSRRIFLDCLGNELLGLNSLLLSIIGMLSLAELGIAESISFSLYDPLARDDKSKVVAIMRLYRKMYSIIGLVVAVLGVALFPVLELMVNAPVAMSTVYWAYGLFLLNTVLSYYVAYKRSIISADQRDYIVTNADTIAQIVLTLLQIAVLLLTKNFFAYLILKIVVTLARNIILSVYTDKKYPYLKTEKPVPLSKEYFKNLKDNIKAMFTIRIAGFCVGGTDNMLLSSFVSLGSVAIFNNYNTLISTLNKTFNTVFQKATSVIGNYLVLNGKEECYTLFKRIFFMNFLITSYTSIGIMVVCNEAISVWLGPEYVWAMGILAVLVYNNYSRFILQACEAFRSAAGLFSPKPFVKFLALFEGILNLVASVGLILVMENDVAAVFLGTSISTLVSTVGVPWIVYRFLFERPLKEFFVIYFKYFAVMLAAMLGSGLLFHLLLTSNHLINLIVGIVVCTVVTGVIYLLVFGRTDEFQYNLGIAKHFLHKKLRK